MPELRALELLVTVARTGSFGRAAREHGISQPAVSSRVNNIERLMRMALFDRSAEGVRPTPDGALVIEWADSLLASAARFEAALMELHRSSRARLGIAASRTTAEYLIPPLLVTMQAENPGVDVSVTAVSSAEVAIRVASGRDNLGFVEGSQPPAGLTSVTVVADRLEVVVAPGHPWAVRDSPVEAAELAATPLIHGEEGSETRETLVHVLAAYGAEIAIPLAELSSTAAVKAAVSAGVGPAVISALAVGNEFREGRLVRVPVAGIDLRRRVMAVWPAGRPLLGPSRDFVAIVHRFRNDHRVLRALEAAV